MKDVTATVENRDGATHLVWRRDFDADIWNVWASITEPARLERWIGTWTGDPTTGHVYFQMTAEGADAPSQPHAILSCAPPTRLAVQVDMPDELGGAWRLELTLAEADGVTTLTFAQPMTDPALAASVGPGWEYYLDRLVAAETGADVASVVWDDYYPAQAEAYTDLVTAAVE